MKEYWIIPCNIKHYDIMKRFQSKNTVVWRNAFSIHKGDVAYIYLSAPYSEIRFRCNVISEDVDDETISLNSYAIPSKTSNNYFSKRLKYIVLELETVFPEGTFKLEELRKNGMGQTQIQARADRKLKTFLLSKEGKNVQIDN